MVESVSLINETDLIFVYEIKSIEHTPFIFAYIGSKF